MANSDKNIIIRPSTGSAVDNPNITFTGSNNTPTTLTVQNDGNISYAGSITANSYSGDGRNLSNTNGFSTSLSSNPSSPLYRIYKESKILNVSAGVHTVQSDSNSDNLAFTKAESITISTGATFHVSSGTTFRTNIVDLFPANDDLNVTAQNLNVLGIATIGILTAQQIVGSSVTFSDLSVESSDGTEVFSVTGIGTTSSDPIFEIVDSSNIQSMSVTNNAEVKFFPEYPTGYVGIGITNPTAQLHVVGDVNITGILTAGRLVGLGYTYGNYATAIQHTSGTTYTDTLMQAEITPSSTSSKIHVSGTIQLYAQGSGSATLMGMQVAVTRDNGDGSGNVIQNVKGWGRQPYLTISGTQILQGAVSFDFIDSPSSVGIVTYKVFVNSANTTFTYYSHAYADYANLTTQIFNSDDYIILQEI